MDSDSIDKVINLFYSYRPYGNNFSDSVYGFKFEYNEQNSIKKFLVDKSILEEWGDGKHIITQIGEDIVEIYGGIDKYLEHEKSEKDEKIRLEKLKNEKLYLDTKLARWQVKTFWYVFIFGLFGGFYSMYSMIDSFVGESEEQRIERILESKLQEREQKQKTSTYQTNIDSLSIDISGKK